MRQWLWLPLVVAVLAGSACWPFDGDELGEMQVRRDAGGVEIRRGGEVIEVGDENESLEPRDVVVTSATGRATLNLEGERRVKLRPNTMVRVRSTSALDAERGKVLAAVDDEMTLTFDDVEAVFEDSVFRVDSAFGSARAATYSGQARLASPGQPRLDLPTLFEATVAAGDLPDARKPYELSERDTWDLQFLGDVVELTQELDLLATGFDRQVDSDRPSAAFFQSLVGGPDVSFVRRYLNRAPSDLLIGFTIAENDERLPLGRSFTKAFRLFDDGARWGVAAAIMGVESRPLVADLEDVILGTGVVAADGSTGGAPDFSVAGAPTGPGDGFDGPGDPPPGGGPGDPPPGGGGGDGPDDPDDEPRDCTDFVTCAEQDLREKVDPEPSPTPTGLFPLD